MSMAQDEVARQMKTFRVALVQVGRTQAEADAEICTCATCECNDDCEYAFDLYNTDGDCLALK